MTRLVTLAYGAVILAVALLTARETIEPVLYLYRQNAPGAVALGCAGWLLATIGPLALSIRLLRSSRRLASAWALHLLFIPCALALFKIGESIFLSAAGVSGAGSIEGYALLAASAFLALTISVHSAALAGEGIGWIRRKALVR